MHRLPAPSAENDCFSDPLTTLSRLSTRTNGIFSGTSAPTPAPPLFIYFYSLHPHTHQTVTSMPRRAPDRDSVKTFHPDSVRLAPPAAKTTLGGGTVFTKVGACIVMEGLFIFLIDSTHFPNWYLLKWVGWMGSCTVTLLHLALISRVWVCYLCFWALKSCDHSKTTHSQLRHSCLFCFF